MSTEERLEKLVESVKAIEVMVKVILVLNVVTILFSYIMIVIAL